MPTKLIALPCSASELEAALHKVCDHGGHWSNRIHVCLYKPENRYVLELHDEAFDGQRSTQDGAALGCGDAAALREAVVLALSLLDLKEGVPYKTVSQKDIDFMKAALSALPRNCDVGTPEERLHRYHELCREISDRHERIGEHAPSFAFPTAFEWEDRPYEKGGAE